MKSVQDIMTKDVACCTADDNLFEAASTMKERNVGSIPVCDSNKNLLGMVTDRDLVIRGYAQKKAGSCTVQEVMSDKLVTCTPDCSLEEASEMMSNEQIRRLPVVDNGQLVGIVSLGDLSLDQFSNEAAGHALEEISERPEIH
ncbi:CBS domain-containing protein [Pontibacillus salicampi]|uniref:CBS domain-containing protein n=1 Tax=Pontibacillus salicampi TaxID=1449801 RepID=A0ABV6LNX0_9BACI